MKNRNNFLVTTFLLAVLILASHPYAQAQSIAGFWDWADGQLTIIYPNGTFVIEGETTGTWHHDGGNSYTLRNQRGFVDELKLTNNAMKLKGIGYKQNNPGKTWQMDCSRVNGDPIIGFWKWADGQTTIIKPNGTFEILNEATGNWTLGDNGVYTLQNTAGYTDLLSLSNNGQTLEGVGYKNTNPTKKWKMRCNRF